MGNLNNKNWEKTTFCKYMPAMVQNFGLNKVTRE